MQLIRSSRFDHIHAIFVLPIPSHVLHHIAGEADCRGTLLFGRDTNNRVATARLTPARAQVTLIPPGHCFMSHLEKFIEGFNF